MSNIGAINSWLFDIPYDCENGLTGEVQANQPTCLGGIDETLLRSAVDFQTFVAVDTTVGAVHNVSLYGGEAWGYRYSTTDIPEPAAGGLLGIALLWLAGLHRPARGGRSRALSQATARSGGSARCK